MIVIGLLLAMGIACAGSAAEDQRKSEWHVSSDPPAGSTLGTRRAPTPTAAPVNLMTTNIAPAWVKLSDGDFFVEAQINPYFDVAELQMIVLVDGAPYCNTTCIYADDGPAELSCQAEEWSHREVKRVSIQSPQGDLRCAKSIKSTSQATIFACD